MSSKKATKIAIHIYPRDMCVLILLYMCPHTATCVSSFCDICVLILLHVCPHTAIYVSACWYISSVT
jgi:hypothetical protein